MITNTIQETTEYFDKYLSFCLTKAMVAQDSIAILEDLQVNCIVAQVKLGSYKIVYLLRTILFHYNIIVLIS